jgi:hypothetical protein
LPWRPGRGPANPDGRVPVAAHAGHVLRDLGLFDGSARVTRFQHGQRQTTVIIEVTLFQFDSLQECITPLFGVLVEQPFAEKGVGRSEIRLCPDGLL